MGLSASPERPLSWAQIIVARCFALVTSEHRVRLDFPDGRKAFLGSGVNSVEVALRPPRLGQMLWILIRPGLRTGESFMRGEWEVTQGDLTTFLRIIQTPKRGIYSRIYRRLSDWRGPIFWLRQRGFTVWNRRKVPDHYNVGNELYRRMLDSTEQYSCAFFSCAEADDLETAQQAKLAVSIRRLQLDRSNLSILDIGCGWGALAAELAKRPGDHQVLGITLSSDQLKIANQKRNALAPEIASRLSYRLQDYSDLLQLPREQFDRIISIGMFEHVGLGKHVHYFRCIERGLRSEGRALIHSIIRPSPGAYNEWIRRYIFPGSFLPSLAELVAAAEKAGLVVDAVHIHPPSDYQKTIQAWRDRFNDAWFDLQNLSPQHYNYKFKRMWNFYLSGVEMIFSSDLFNFRIAQIEVRKGPNIIDG